VRGAVNYYREGLGTPDEVKKATAEYRAEQDTFADFLAECCDEGTNYTAFSAELYVAHESWCRTNGEDGLSRKAFAERLKVRKFQPASTGSKRIWRGLRLRRGYQKDCVNGNNQFTLFRERNDDANYTRTFRRTVERLPVTQRYVW